MKKVLVLLVLASVLALAVASCGTPSSSPAPMPVSPTKTETPTGTPTATPGKPTATTVPTVSPTKPDVIKIRMGSMAMKPDTTQGWPEQWFADEVKRRTGGQVVTEIGWGFAFGQPNEYPHLVSSGALEMAQIHPPFIPGVMPFLQFLSEPAAQDFSSDPLTGYGIGCILLEEFPIFEQEFAKQNVKLIQHYAVEPYYLFGSKKISSLADFKGAKVRTSGTYMPGVITSTGATTVAMATTELYEALERGTVDLTSAPPGYSISIGLHEISKYFLDTTLLSGYAYAGGQCMNLDFWNRLPADIQDIIVQVGREAGYLGTLEVVKRIPSDRKIFEAKAQFIKLSDADLKAWRASFTDPVDLFVESMEKKGLGGEARAMRERIKELMAGLRPQ